MIFAPMFPYQTVKINESFINSFFYFKRSCDGNNEKWLYETIQGPKIAYKLLIKGCIVDADACVSVCTHSLYV